MIEVEKTTAEDTWADQPLAPWVEVDAATVGRFRDGDATAVKELLRVCHGPVARMVNTHYYSLVNDVEDILTEAMAKAWRSLQEHELNKPFMPWFMRIAHNVAIDELRKKRHITVVELDEATCPEPEDQHDGHPAERLHRQEAVDVYRLILGTFEPRDRDIMDLWDKRDDDDGGWATAAAMQLGMTVGAVRKQQARVLLIIRRKMRAAGYWATWNRR